MTWREQAEKIIYDGTRDLPDDMPLKERIRVVKSLCPWWWRQMSWPQKAWQAARRDYLIKYGYQPRTKPRRKCQNTGPMPLFDEEKT